MSTYNPRTFTSLGVLRSIPGTLLLRFFEPHRVFLESQGFAWPTAEADGALDYAALHDALLKPAGPAPDKRLAEAMFVVDEMANPEGVAALVEALRETDKTYKPPQDPEPAIFVISIWLKNPELVEDTNARRYARENRTFHSFRSSSALPKIKRVNARDLLVLQDRIAARLADTYPRESIKLFQYPDDEVIRFLVRHGGPLEREGIIDLNDPGRSDSYIFRREVFDVVIYDAPHNELRIHAKKRDCDLYTRAFGEHFLDDDDAFPDVDKYTLDPLRLKGASSLACSDIAGLKKVTLVEIEVFYGGKFKESTIRRATDIFESPFIKKNGIALGGQLLSARFCVEFTDSKRVRYVTVRVPNKANFKRDTDGKLVEQWLRAAGFVLETVADEGTPSSELAHAITPF